MRRNTARSTASLTLISTATTDQTLKRNKNSAVKATVAAINRPNPNRVFLFNSSTAAITKNSRPVQIPKPIMFYPRFCMIWFIL